ncbi:DEAD/DEAH box helicase [Mangrovicoccus sp. HB161399]|uniref:DEAD/DEAH box helicase n=1 Tax=Mangrovicoccus sp. HB161399 TaxID=2720392 RepID=UPI001554DFCD|nr:DEAD/DEAH box helicase [Mangrovicoccus sp. HB161399]
MITTLQDALAERGYDSLTSVQEAVTNPELADSDLLVSAQTGSGKTVGFGLAIAPTLLGEAETLGPAAAPLALVVAPTRELALQVARELGWLYAKAGARISTCIGGMDARDERRSLERGAHIVVGTPGRLRDHITRGSLDLNDIRAVVLDEADEMLDLGFREDLEFMLGEAPEERRTLLFSATVPRTIEDMARTYQRDAVRVTTLDKGSQHTDITYQAVQVSPGDEENAIINLLRFHDAPTAIVFANTRAAVTRLSARLANRGFLVASLSGELSQDERSHALQSMRDGRARVCVATDVAARGIDLPNLDLVVHADLPQSTEALLHRSGRTGRAGRKGISALIVTDRAVNKAGRILKWAKVQAEWVFAPSADEILDKDEARLLDDEAWSQEPNEREAAFAAKLIEAFTPEQIAIACFRLYQNKLSAPEELNVAPMRKPRDDREPRERGERPERREFGPSVWAKLSIGRDKNAEPRWILPLLCRAGGLDKTQIGKIRVTDEATYVELAEAAGPGLGAHLGEGGVLEDDIRLEMVDSVPDEVTRPAPRRTGGPRRDRDDDARPHRKGPPRRDREAAAEGGSSYRSAPAGDAPRPPRPVRREEGEFRPKKREFSRDGDRDERPKKREFSRDGDAGEFRKKRDFDRGGDDKRPAAKPKDARFGDASKSFRRPEAGEHSKSRRPAGDKPWAKKDGDERPRSGFGKPRAAGEGAKPPYRAKTEGFRPKTAGAKPRPAGGPKKPGKKF